MRRARVLMANEAALMRTDPFPVLVLFVTPTLFLLFLANGLAIGPAGAVAGVTTVFGYIGLSVVGVAMFRDHGWHTHDRYRASPLRVSEYFAGKAVPLFVLFALQKVVLLAVGWRAQRRGDASRLGPGGRARKPCLLVREGVTCRRRRVHR